MAGAEDSSWLGKVRWQALANVGREGHTVLHHCLRLKRGEAGKDDPAGERHTLFLQGSIDDHKGLVFPYWSWNLYLKQGFVAGGVETLKAKDSGFMAHSNEAKARLQPTKLTLAEYYEHLLKRPFPGEILVSYCNCFAVKNARILAHAEAFYQRAIDTLAIGPNPEAGHYFERLVLSIFGAFAGPFSPILG
jgi:hypothetical protein